MKKIARMAAVLAVLCAAACGGERHIGVAELPDAAQRFLSSYFADASVAYAQQSKGQIDKEYEVVFHNGDKVEFSRRGEWKEVDCRRSKVPAALIPQPVADYVSEHYGGQDVVKIERGRKGYEVKLSNQLDLKFDREFGIREIDD